MKDPCIVFVGQRPFRVWRKASLYRDQYFLSGMETDLHVGVGELLEGSLAKGQTGDRTSLAIRLHYGLAQEAFFALLFAALQAPEVPTAWLHLYRNSDLLKLIEIFGKGEDFPSIIRCPEPGSWESLAEMTVPKSLLDDDSNRRRVRHLGRFWEEWAAEQTSTLARAEFNALKHGLRIRGASPFLSIDGHQIEGDEHGSSFPTATRSGPDVVLDICGCSWSGPTLLARMRLMALSSRNVLAMLRVLHRAGDTCRLNVEVPDEEELSAATASRMPLKSLTLSSSWDESHRLEPLDIVEARRQYDERSATPHYDGTVEQS